MNNDEIIQRLRKTIKECNLILAELLKQKNSRTKLLNKNLTEEMQNAKEIGEINDLETKKLILMDYKQYKKLVFTEESEKVRQEILNGEMIDKERMLSFLLFLVLLLIYNIVIIIFPYQLILKNILIGLVILLGGLTFAELSVGPILAINKRVKVKLNEAQDIRNKDNVVDLQNKIDNLQLELQNKRKNYLNKDQELNEIIKNQNKMKKWLLLFVDYLDKIRANQENVSIKEEDFLKFNEEKQQLTLKK